MRPAAPWSPSRSVSRLCALAAVLVLLALPVSAQREDEIIQPRARAESPAAAPGGRGSPMNSCLLLAAFAAAAVGGWLLWRQRQARGGVGGRGARRLAVAESCSLGNRQYLVVADYDGAKYLLGVCPGRIDLLAPLPGSDRPKSP